MLGISKDTVDDQRRFKEKLDLPFPLLSDPDLKVAASFGAVKDKNVYGKPARGVERSTFVIGADGRVKRVFPKVKPEGHAAEVMAVLT